MKRTTSAIRTIVQIAFFVLLPGLFVEGFAGIYALVKAFSTGSFTTATAQSALALVAILVVTIACGRVFCGWACAFGAMGDLLGFIGKKLHLRRRVPKDVDANLKWVKYGVLALIFGLVWTGVVALPESWNPWEAFAALATFPPDIATVTSSFGVGLVLLVAIMVASLFVERPFCRYLCPFGAALGIVSKIRIVRIRKPRRSCGGHCSACTKACSMGIDLGQTDKVGSGECVMCLRCQAVCPRENVTVGASAPDAAPAIGTVAALSLAGLYYGGNIGISAWDQVGKATATTVASSQTAVVSESTATSTTTQQPASTTSSAPAASSTAAASAPESSSSAASSNSSGYADGTYTGSGHGHKGTTTVQVTISGGEITNITTVSTGDDTPYYNRAFSTVSQEIISSQSTDVDAVSGATHSSDGIMSAVASALASAKS
jgi:polyferredoxin/uncharacterized protein with FMN-binding domain